MPFTYEGVLVRSVLIGGEPWFIVSDAAKVLGYRDASNAARLLRPHQQGYSEVSTPSGIQRMLVANEGGINRLIMRSNASNAEAVQDWFTDEVLPAIRKAGSYSVAAQLPDRKALARMVIEAEEAREVAEAKVAELAPKADAFDSFLNGEGLYLIGTVARILGVGQTTMFRFLYEQKVLISSGSRKKQPYANPKFDGWFRPRTHDQERTNGHASVTTMVTPRGAEGIRLLAVEKGLIEPQLIGLPGMKELGA